ncbi:hypothetical protein D1872_314140 [compost metagenome]
MMCLVEIQAYTIDLRDNRKVNLQLLIFHGCGRLVSRGLGIRWLDIRPLGIKPDLSSAMLGVDDLHIRRRYDEVDWLRDQI